MKLMEGKKGVIFGLANEQSIAFACADILKQHGAKVAVTYLMPDESYKKYLEPHIIEAGLDIAMKCDATKEEELEIVFDRLKKEFGTIDFVVHSMAFAKKEELGVIPFHKISLEGFQVALNISAYTLIKLASYAVDLMPNGGTITSMSYYGSRKVVPNYDVMGVAKASLEAITRYLAADLGEKNIRVNAISPGPIHTRAASGIKGFDNLIETAIERSPLRRIVTSDEVGNVNLFLCSDLSTGITGEVLYVDGGANIIGV
jgi:enoyl-[acyl-carrier protein] reductase I